MDRLPFQMLPPVSRVLILAPVTVLILVSFNLISGSWLVFVPARILQGEFWRLLTGMLYMSHLYVLMELVFPVMYASRELEIEYYASSKAYLWRVILIGAASLLSCAAWDLNFPLVVMYVALNHMASSRRDIPAQILLLNVLVVSENVAIFLPLVKTYLFDMGEFRCWCLGIFIGHVMVVLEDIIPQWTGRNLLDI